MGVNQSSAQKDDKLAAANIGHFDHSYEALLITASPGMVPEPLAGAPPRPPAIAKKLGDEGRFVELVMKFDTVQLCEVTNAATGEKRTLCLIPYGSLKSLEWDHSCSSVKMVTGGREAGLETFAVVKVHNSLELENEAKLRLRGLSRASNAAPVSITFGYCGVYAGPTKPKPFQRKRANLSTREQGKLPPLALMRDLALARHLGSGAPTRANGSKRLVHALEHIHKGGNTFAVMHAYERGVATAAGANGMNAVESKLALTAGDFGQPGIAYVEGQKMVLEHAWADVLDYEVHDKVHQGEHSSGIEITFADKAGGSAHKWFFVVLDVLQLGDAVEHFWNRREVAAGRPPRPRSTHGRAVAKVTTLHGEIDAPKRPRGDLDVVDEHGTLVRSSGTAHGGVAKRKSTLMGSIKGKKANGWALNDQTNKYWDSVVVHQGWLLKKGGLAKSWIKRYAVLYETAMGHFLCYYADFAKAPLFHPEERERRIIDLCKTTFVRPVSSRAEAPPNSFDICTIEREWTLSADSKQSMQTWLQVITRCIDEDVAIVPDDELVFHVKPRVDPSMQLVKNEYSTALKVSASGVSVCAVASNEELVERFFWCYTDFFKWSILHHGGKTGLQVSVFTSADFNVKDRHEFLFRTRDAVKLATAIEFYIEKFMSAMHLYLEGAPPDAAPAAGDSGGMAMATAEMASDNLLGDDALLLGGDDDDDSQKAAAPPPPPQTGQDVQSILDLFTTPTAAGPAHAADDPFNPAPPAAPPPAPPGADLPDPMRDPFAAFDGGENLADDVSALSVDTGHAAPVTMDHADDMVHASALFEALAVGAEAGAGAAKGLLFENDHVRVAVEQDYRGSEGRVTVRVANKASAVLAGLATELDVGATGLRHEFGPLSGTTLAPNEAAAQLLMLECMRPYDAAPTLVVKFGVANVPYELRLALPALFTKFLEAVPLSPNVFVQRWATLGAPGLEHMVTFAARRGAATKDAALPRLRDLAQIAVVEGVDDGGGTILSGATALRTGTLNAGGEKISVGCLVRLEMNEAAAAFRLTVRTAVPHVSTALSDAIQNLL